MSPAPKPNEIQLIRLYDAPVEAVWDAWTQDHQVSQWWGPRGFSITTHHKELKVGGTWEYTMLGPDGVTYENTTTYLEVKPLAKLVYDHGANKTRPPLFRVTVLFKEVDGKTEMDMTMALSTPEAAQQTRGFIKKAGGESTWDRFSEYLTKQQTGRDVFVIQRAFNTPIERMYAVWTSADLIAQWLPPTGATMTFLRADIRPGGSSFYRMPHGPLTMYGRITYREMEKPRRLLYTQQFCDEKENISRHPMAPIWPETMLTAVLFTEEAPGQTRVKVTWEPEGKTTPEELAAFLQMRGSMTQGWTGSLDKLEEVFAKP